jgi:hypothetical protein
MIQSSLDFVKAGKGNAKQRWDKVLSQSVTDHLNCFSGRAISWRGFPESHAIFSADRAHDDRLALGARGQRVPESYPERDHNGHDFDLPDS